MWFDEGGNIKRSASPGSLLTRSRADLEQPITLFMCAAGIALATRFFIDIPRVNAARNMDVGEKERLDREREEKRERENGQVVCSTRRSVSIRRRGGAYTYNAKTYPRRKNANVSKGGSSGRVSKCVKKKRRRSRIELRSLERWKICRRCILEFKVVALLDVRRVSHRG